MRGRDPDRMFYLVVTPSNDDGSLDPGTDLNHDVIDTFDEARRIAVDSISGCPMPRVVYEVTPIWRCQFGPLTERKLNRPEMDDNWIPVSERLPRTDRLVEVQAPTQNEHPTRGLFRYQGLDFRPRWFSLNGYELIVTYWRELPLEAKDERD